MGELRVPERDIIQRVKSNLSELRFRHTEGVVLVAEALAKKHGLSVEKARVAAWVHDIAREWPISKLEQEAERVEIPSGFASIPALLHGPIAAHLATEWFGIEDEDVLNSIRFHTTARVGMSKLEQVIYLADATEPQRKYPEVDAIREEARKDLDRALAMSLDSTIEYLIETHQPIFPLTIMARNDVWEQLLSREGTIIAGGN